MAGPPFAQSRQRVNWEDGSKSDETGDKALMISRREKALKAKPTHGIGTALLIDKRESGGGRAKKPLSPVIDKRSVKQKLKDAQSRRP